MFCLFGNALTLSLLSHLTEWPPPGHPPGSARQSAAAAACCLMSGHDETKESFHTSHRIHTLAADKENKICF